MSYLAIARKYRPATFDEMVGQEHVTRTLENALSSGRIHHAFLFTGARGVGKTTAARALARALNCEKGPTAQPCGSCTSCKEISSGSSPDLVEIDGASNNSVDDIRELRDTVNYAPTGRYRIYLIDEVHMLSKAAFNALLKTLEEPPPHVVFLFATTEPHKILDTILSRVQRFDFKRIPLPAVVARLTRITRDEGAQIEEGGLRLIARAGEGSMRDAESLLDKVISFSAPGEPISEADVASTLGLIDRSLLHEMLGGLVTGEPARCLDVIDRVYGYGHELSQFTGDLMELVRNATFIRLSETSRKHVDLPAGDLERLLEFTADVQPETLTRLFSALLEVHDRVSRASRPRIVLEMAVAQLASVRPVQPLGALVDRLHDLERRLRGGGAPAGTPGLRSRSTGAGTSRGQSGGPAKGGGRGDGPGPAEARSNQGVSAGTLQAEPPPQPRPESPPAPVVQGARPNASPNRPREEPPPWSDADIHGAPNVAPKPGEASTELPAWVQLQALLKDLPGGAKRLANAKPVWQRGRLVLQIPAGRALAEGRRVADRDDVLRAVRSVFPRAEGFAVVAQPGTGTASDKEKALRGKVLADRRCRTIIETLGAQLERVVSLEDPPDDEPPDDEPPANEPPTDRA